MEEASDTTAVNTEIRKLNHSHNPTAERDTNLNRNHSTDEHIGYMLFVWLKKYCCENTCRSCPNLLALSLASLFTKTYTYNYGWSNISNRSLLVIFTV